MTRARLEKVSAVRALLSHCPGAKQAVRSSSVVERVGYHGSSVTFLVTRTSIAGCDRTPKARAFTGAWCGIPGWNFTNGRVSDPRLALCYGTARKPIAAFAWINPVGHAKWIVVDQPGYREVYPVASDLPVRVSTISDIDPVGTTFRVAQYDARGVLLIRRNVVAAIAS
jgi:hypothetical protein